VDELQAAARKPTVQADVHECGDLQVKLRTSFHYRIPSPKSIAGVGSRSIALTRAL
jgi:hypothetical protein